jgi:quinol monooxygenase YgiN
LVQTWSAEWVWLKSLPDEAAAGEPAGRYFARIVGQHRRSPQGGSRDWGGQAAVCHAGCPATGVSFDLDATVGPYRSSASAAKEFPKITRERAFDMLTITAVIRVKKGHEDTMRRALLEVAENVRLNEPDTLGFFVSQEQENPGVFTTYERFRDQEAMDAHNNSKVVARFFGIAKPILDGDVILVTSTEISAKA